MKTLFFHGNRDKKEIAITFDDGPCRETRNILKILKKEKVPATFFILGKKIRGNEGVLKQIINQGCEIGNHTYNHIGLVFKTPSRIEKEINSVDKELIKLNIKTNLVRCPYFRFGPIAFFIAKKLKKKIIFGEIDSEDWKKLDQKKIIENVLKKVKNGSILCFHDYIEGIGKNKNLILIIKKIIPKLKKRGYKLVTVSGLLTVAG